MARGMLRIYLGAAAGVGKTFAMLNEGRRRSEYGEDVVVGFVEAHGRRKTVEQIGDLEVVPRRRARYRGGEFEELDVDAVLARRPHGRARRRARAHECPGLAQREALAGRRAAARGRDQRHLDAEHPAPRVAQRRRRADHRRSSSGRRSRIRSSGGRTSCSSSISRRMLYATGSPAATSTRRSESTLRSPTTSDRGTCPLSVSSRSPGSPTGSTRGSPSTAVDTGSSSPGRPASGCSSRSPDRATATGSSAAPLGSPSAPRATSSPSTSYRRMASRPRRRSCSPASARSSPSSAAPTTRSPAPRSARRCSTPPARSNATQIVMGATRRSRWQRLTRGSVIGKVIRAVGRRDRHSRHQPSRGALGGGVRRPPHAAPGRAAAPAAGTRVPPGRRRPSPPDARARAAPRPAGAAERDAALPAPRRRGRRGGGLWPGLAAAVGGFVLVNFFFIEPHHTLTIADAEDVLALVVFLAVGAIVSRLRRSRRPPGRGRRPRPRRGGGSLPARPAPRPSPRCSNVSAACSASTAQRCSTASTAAGGSRRRAGSAFPRAPRRAPRRASSTPSTCSRSSGDPSAARTSACSTPSPRNSQPRCTSASSRRRPGPRAGCPRRTSCEPHCSPPCPTTCARRSPRSRPRSPACCSATSTGHPRRGRSSSTRSTRRPTG